MYLYLLEIGKKGINAELFNFFIFGNYSQSSARLEKARPDRWIRMD